MGIEKIKELIKILKEKDNFLVATHINYDPDALSSLIATGIILKNLNKNFSLYLDEELKEEYSWVPLKEKIIKEINGDYENFILVDCESYRRISEKIQKVFNDKFKIFIDHHQTNKLEGDFNLVADAISTTEIIFYLAKELKIQSAELATLLLLGIMGDSSNLTVELSQEKLIKIFEMVTDLIKLGGDLNLVNQTLLLKPFAEFKKLAEIFNQVNQEDGIFWVVIEGREVQSGALANNLNKIREAKVIIVIEDFENYLRIHFRSKGNIDVAELAQRYFNGGGHKNASGGRLEMNLEEGVAYILKIVKDYLKENAF
ncbi:putative bifunctional oligoribonuclease and PAP phosphatase NrnA [bacterium HR35]|nr:putative bifunctional oligoribonuclease and PAP phosphatase NrnA [bacterium HR35]